MSQASSTTILSANFAAIFTAALEAYNKQTKYDITTHPLASQLQACHSPASVLAVLRAQVQALGQSQSADDKPTKWLDPTVNVLYALSATLGNSVGLVFPPANAIFTGIGVLLQAIKDVRASQDAVIDLFYRMEYFFKRLEKYIEVRPTAAMADIIGKILVEVISILGIVTKEVRQGRMKTYLKKLVGRKDIEDALQRLDKLTQEEARMAAAEALSITRGIDDKVQGVGDKVKDIDDKVNTIDHKLDTVKGAVIQGVKETKETTLAIQQVIHQVRNLNRNELRKELRKWVTPPDPSVNYNAASDAHHEGTAAWFTNGNTAANWKTSGSLLWIHGIPGSGKSILSSVVIQDVKTLSDAGLAFLAYFYFDFKDTGKQDSRALLSSLLVQLSDQSDTFCDAFFSLYTAHEQGLEQPTNHSLVKCLESMLTIAGQVPIYLIIDALDESPNDSGIPSPREMVLELVEHLVELRHPSLRLCITSRPEYDIRVVLEPLATEKVSLHDESGQKQDISDYVSSVVHSDRKMKRWRDDDKNAVIEKLTEKADGMFRWVFCQLEVLRYCFPANLRHVLEELPKSLDETYKRILKQINNANQAHAYRLLQCLLVAIRPLRVEELAEVLAVDFNAGGIPKLNTNWRWEDHEEAVLSACSSLVSVIIDDGHRVVQFSHFSVKEFLTSDRLANSAAEELSHFYIPLEPAHAILAQACLGVLLNLSGHTETPKSPSPLVKYAAEYWVKHAQFENVESHMEGAIEVFFDTDKPHLSAWLDIHDVDDPWWRPGLPVQDPRNPLYVAALCGFRHLVEHLIVRYPEHLSAQAGRYGTPLHASLFEGGHVEVSKLLIEHGADVNAPNVDKWTPLHFASRYGHLDVVQWLLGRGAAANFQSGDGVTPLHLSARHGHFVIARMLLEHNAEVNARSADGSTPFLLALDGGHSDVTQLFLDHHANAFDCNNKGESPLHLGAASGCREVTQTLLERGAEINSQTVDGLTPLFYASWHGRLDTVRILLDHNADVHIRENCGDTPLHYAALYNHIKIAQMLLEHMVPVEVNSRDNRGYTPLLVASYEGRVDIVRLLLKHDADFHMCDDIGWTPLHRSAWRGHLEISRILLEHAADVDARTHHQSTPFLLAAEHGTPDVVRLLLDHNADTQARDIDGDTALHCAALHGHLEKARILLEHNPDINSLNENGMTPLHYASEGRPGGHPEFVRFLLDHGADPLARNFAGESPAEVARGPRQQEIVQMLSEHAALNQRDEE